MMEVTFTNQRLAKLCNSEKNLRAKFGPRMAALIMQRLMDLSSVHTLAEMRTLPGRCHELTQNLKGRLALDLVHPDRLIFEPNHHPPPQLPAGGLDWGQVIRVVVVAIGDYHG